MLAALRGDCHTHTTWSDGGAPLRAMAHTAMALGHEWLVVTDHSDNMGWVTDLKAGKPELLADEYGKKWYGMIQEGKGNEAALETLRTKWEAIPCAKNLD